MKIDIRVDPAELNQARQDLAEYAFSLQMKGEQICQRLASLGAVHASLGFSRSLYEGNGSFDISVERVSRNGYAVIASGDIVLFLEFGAGVTMGGGHPQADEFGFGPETYPGQTHAGDKDGWWFRMDGKAFHSYGNPPNMAMYNASKEVEAEIERVCREVLSQ